MRARGLALLFALTCLPGCISRPVADRALDSEVPGHFYQDVGDGDAASLFPGDAAVLTDDEIARILTYKLDLARPHRIAVLSVDPAWYWSEEHVASQGAAVARLVEHLRTAPGVVAVAPLPALLVPQKKTVPFLREAAARFQADLLIAYDTDVATFTRSRVVAQDRVKALCRVEAVLLDVPTGIVAFTSTASETITAEESRDHVNLQDTIAQATAAAQGRALERIADELSAFLHGERK